MNRRNLPRGHWARILFGEICKDDSGVLASLVIDYYRGNIVLFVKSSQNLTSGRKDERLREWSGADKHMQQVL